MTPYFSVVIPVYNRAQSLAVAIRSVLDQSERNFEVIVVDDGSADDPERVVRAFHDPRIFFVHQDNRGGSAARNAGIDRASGRFIAFLDSDDIFFAHHLSAARRVLEGTKDLAAYAPIVVDRGQGRTFIKPPRALGNGEHMATYLLCERGFVPTITLVVPRPWARRVRYGETLPCSQDTDFAIRLFLAGCRFAMMPEPAAQWQDRADANRVSAGRKSARLQGWLEELRPRIPKRSYYGGRGWMIAKGIAQTRPFTAFRLYLVAVLRGCYRPKLAGIVFLQIFLRDSLYRRGADRMIAWYRGHVWSRGDRAAKPILR